ncbi:Copper amine oxidase N-terminal domain-containing protein [Paenibacillus algorifonticola]|uniref:Copper amine oxidase N-terminal domain-containing protein n=1 Tax=Paenibacillus algorifonticola TaxID=684063 RepID=A0A1I2FKQ5_9BACL|nr:copper amine oxidase N-terminal domain-containing protein [Paenibacillus algorifonticola]SFF05190.1 Copper amine oxidase N-terminal domain-containing protein [Paenibacillus algorifonticola]
MIKRFIGILLVLCLGLSIPVPAFADDKTFELYLNNEKLIGINPVLEAGVMYVPYRKLFNVLGYKVAYDSDTEEISASNNDSEIFFWAGEDIVESNEGSYLLDKPISIMNGQVYLPIRLVGQLTKHSTKENDTYDEIWLWSRTGH